MIRGTLFCSAALACSYLAAISSPWFWLAFAVLLASQLAPR